QDVGKTIRLKLKWREAAFREFSLQAHQSDVRAAIVPLTRLQSDLDQKGKANTILVANRAASLGLIERTLKDRYALEDLGVRIRTLERQHRLSLESESALISDALADAASTTAKSLGLRVEPVLTYLANSIRVGGREVPYSVGPALDSPALPSEPDGITLNQWTAHELGAKPGDTVTLEYYLWRSAGRLHTDSARSRLARVAPLEGAAADRDLAPPYPG